MSPGNARPGGSRRPRPALLAALVALWSSACANEPVSVELNFPSQQTFLHSEFARIQVFDLVPGRLGNCPTLITQGIAGTGTVTPRLDSGAVPVCSLFDGGVEFEEIDEGPKAYLAVVRNDANIPLLAGCTIAEVYADAPTIVVHLSMTSEYAGATATPPACTNVDDKCVRGCR